MGEEIAFRLMCSTSFARHSKYWSTKCFWYSHVEPLPVEIHLMLITFFLLCLFFLHIIEGLPSGLWTRFTL